MDPFVPGFVAPEASAARLFALEGHKLCVLERQGRFETPVGAASEASGWLFIGALSGVPCFTRKLARGEPPPDGTALVSMRALFGALGDAEFAVAARAMTLLEWDEAHRFCGRCGERTERSAEERSRVCPKCGSAHYPRLSPAVIVLVERGDEVLLARNARWPQGPFSLLAGFVEVGESLEDAVHREIHEESALAVKDVAYFGSQSWPFTNSMMIGFRAQYAGGTLQPDPRELLDAAWFRANALPPSVSGRISIAGRMIEDFAQRRDRIG